MKRKHRRLAVISLALIAFGVAVGLILNAMQSSLVFFIGPSEVAGRDIDPGTAFRLGGLVKTGSVEKIPATSTTLFDVTDGVAEVRVSYRGLLPDLFREGQGVVAEGAFDADRRFIATKVLAKHDERYMPPEVAEALKRSGQWRDPETGALVPAGEEAGS